MDRDREALDSPAVYQSVLQGTPSSVPAAWGGGLPQNQENSEVAGKCPKGSFKGAGQWSCI